MLVPAPAFNAEQNLGRPAHMNCLLTQGFCIKSQRQAIGSGADYGYIEINFFDLSAHVLIGVEPGFKTGLAFGTRLNRFQRYQFEIR